jgi:hypothetical protein
MVFIEMAMTHVLNYFDGAKGWENSNPGWHEAIIYNNSPDKHEKMLEWLYNKVDNVERHARWIWCQDHGKFKFRYERDYIMFTLTWQ